MTPTFRCARPTNALEPLRRFYVDGVGCAVQGRFEDHAGFDGLILGAPGESWQLELVVERGVTAPRAPTAEHLLVFYVDDAAALDSRVAALRRVGAREVAPNNPYWRAHGVTFEDPDGYHVVIARRA